MKWAKPDLAVVLLVSLALVLLAIVMFELWIPHSFSPH
jgi:hypothetical protein